MRYLSVCSGIEAASVAWAPLGWTPVAFSEIEPFPCAVLAHRFPDVPNWGDMTKYEDWPDADVDVLCGGTPCQSFSVAGLRKGLADPRGNLMLTFGAIAGRYRPRWLVWENVPGVLSSNGGRDFGAFLGMLGQLGYGFAYRVLDAQHVRTRRLPRAVPQRRRRVFVVGYLGDWRRAAAVLFDRESLSGHPAPRRETGQRVAARAHDGAESRGIRVEANSGDVGYCLTASAQQSLDAETETETLIAVAHTLRGEGYDASEDGCGRGTPIVPVQQPYVLMERGRDGMSNLEYRQDGTANAILTPNGGRNGFGVGTVATTAAVRRLAPRECERLMGFTDDFTRIPWGARKKIEAHELLYIRLTNPGMSMDEARSLASDGPRYKAIGNSWATNCAEWIGERIAIVDQWRDA